LPFPSPSLIFFNQKVDFFTKSVKLQQFSVKATFQTFWVKIQ
jgi:hypothetical protein